MVDFAIIGTYLACILAVGLYYGLKVTTVADYAVAGKNYPTPIIVATILATLIGGASTIGVAEQFFSVGVIFYIVCLGAVFRDLITAQWIIPKMGDLSGLVSSGDLMYRYYGRPGQIVTGFASLFRCIGFIGTQISALGFLGNYFLGIPYSISALGSCAIIVFYSSFGGIRSVTITDLIQFGVLLVAIPMVCSFGINAAGGHETMWSSLPQTHISLLADPFVLVTYFGLALVFLLPDMDPAILQRLLMGRDLQQGRLSIFITSFVSIPIYALAGFIGLTALAINPDLEANLAFPYLLNSALPAGIRGIAISGILAVVMSTADSYLNIGGISLIHDIVRPISRKKISDKWELRLIQWGTVMLGIISTICALILPNIFKLAVAALALWKPIIFPPLLIGILGFNKSKKLFYVGILSSLTCLLLWNFLFKSRLGINGILAASLLHFVILLSPYLLRLISKKAQKEVAR